LLHFIFLLVILLENALLLLSRAVSFGGKERCSKRVREKIKEAGRVLETSFFLERKSLKKEEDFLKDKTVFVRKTLFLKKGKRRYLIVF
jgi:hypothetical protein